MTVLHNFVGEIPTFFIFLLPGSENVKKNGNYGKSGNINQQF
jgi:hypothetical protein